MKFKKLFLVTFFLILGSSAVYAASCSDERPPLWVQRLIEQGEKWDCRWYGSAPICKGKCPNGFVEIIRSKNECGQGNDCATGNKVYCCGRL
jgi:hypothetical protein